MFVAIETADRRICERRPNQAQSQEPKPQPLVESALDLLMHGGSTKQDPPYAVDRESTRNARSYLPPLTHSRRTPQYVDVTCALDWKTASFISSVCSRDRRKKGTLG